MRYEIVLTSFKVRLKQYWQILRHISGDDDYERYLVHHQAHHADLPVLDRGMFFRSEQQRKWEGIRRCC